MGEVRVGMAGKVTYVCVVNQRLTARRLITGRSCFRRGTFAAILHDACDVVRVAAPERRSRRGVALGCAAQRKFMSWWLLWAPAEYPAVFSWNRRHTDIAMQFVALGNGLRCPQLLLTLHEARHDLQQAFPLDSASSLVEYFHWYQQRGSIELATAPLLPKSCLASCEGTPLPSRAAQPSCTGIANPTETRRPKQVLAKEGVNLIGRYIGNPAWAKTCACCLPHLPPLECLMP